MAMRKLKVTSTTDGVTTTSVADNNEFINDEGKEAGGKDLGPNPLQNVLGSLAACENITARLVAREMEFKIDDLNFEVEGEFDPKGFMGVPDVRPYYETITLQAKISTNESEERIKELQEKVEARCPIYAMLKAANIKIHETWTKA